MASNGRAIQRNLGRETLRRFAIMSRMTEEVLAGGKTTANVVRIGDTVHRSANERSAFIAELLTYLDSVDFPYAPRHLGRDDQGRDVLTYIDGQTASDLSHQADAAYAMAGRMLRDLHDATTGHRLAGDAECVLHGDPGPYNTISRNGQPIAFIDWDAARPGNRIDELGFLAWTWCIQADGHTSVAVQTELMRHLHHGYGDFEAVDVLDAVIRAQRSTATHEAEVLNDAGRSKARQAWAQEAINWANTDRAFTQANYDAILAVLSH